MKPQTPKVLLALIAVATAALIPTSAMASGHAQPGTVLYRVNAGGPELVDAPLNWSVDTAATPSPFHNAGSSTFTAAFTGTNTTVAPDALFSTERWDGPAAPEMAWNFPVAVNGTYTVRLYFAEIFFAAAGARVFNVTIEGTPALTAYDIYDDVGADAVVHEFTVPVTDGFVSIDFGHVTENPKISGIEILEGVAFTPLVIDKAFAPSTIQPGAISTLTFTIDNNSGVDATNVAFTDNLPAGVEVAATPNPTNTCGGTFTAPAAATTVDLAVGALTNGSSCTLSVDVTAAAVGDYVNTTSAITSDETPDGLPASATLRVRTGGGGGRDKKEKKEEEIFIFATPIPAAAEEFIEKTEDRSVAAIGDVVTYTVKFRNPKDVTLTEVVVEDVFDSRLENIQIVSASKGEATVEGNKVTLDGFELAPGESATLVVRATISARAKAGDTISNTATLESPDASVHVSNTVFLTIISGELPVTGFAPVATDSDPQPESAGLLEGALVVGGLLSLLAVDILRRRHVSA